MKISIKTAWALALCLSVRTLSAGATPAAELRLQLQDLQQEFERTRQEQQRQIDALTKKLDALTNPTASTTAASPAPDKLAQQLAAELGAGPVAGSSAKSDAAGFTPSPTDASQPSASPGRAGSTYMNLSYGAILAAGWSTAEDPSAQLQLGDHDPAKRGFALRNAELALDGAVDPYFQAFANIVLKLDRNNGMGVELEESFLQSTSLPANLQLKAGQYFANFGRQNSQHPHTWSFADQPLILSHAFGPDGLRSLGAQLSWLAPTPFYTEVFLSVLDGQGGTGFSFRYEGEPDAAGVPRYAGRATVDRNLRGARDLLFVLRVAFSAELTDTQTLLAREIGGDRIDLTTLAKPTEDPHFVDAKPSFIVKLNHANALIEGGAELESGWLAPLLQGARNPRGPRPLAGRHPCHRQSPLPDRSVERENRRRSHRAGFHATRRRLGRFFCGESAAV